MTRRSKREIENALEEMAGSSVGQYPQATVAEVLKAEEVAVKKEVDDGYLLDVDGDTMGLTNSMAEILIHDAEE